MSNNRPEITAEWTVHAQLTISRSGNSSSKPKTASTTNQDSKDDCNDACSTSKSPVNFVYKWSSHGQNADDTASDQPVVVNEPQQTETTSNSFNVRQENYSLKPEINIKNNSFNSTSSNNPLPSDSGVSATSNTSTKHPPFNPQCKSTCSIVLSACTDLYPMMEDEEVQNDNPFTCYTTYSLTPEKVITKCKNPCNILSVKDAFSQTSDTENKFSDNTSYGRKRRTYDHRRNTVSLMAMSPPLRHTVSPCILDEETKLQTSSRSSSMPRYKYSPMPTISPPLTKPNKKQPRTVHIDVYCTGSEAEDDDGEDNDHETSSISTSSTSENIFDNDSIETPQTVYDTKQMKLHHSRITNKQDLPRRIANQILEKKNKNKSSALRKFLLSTASSKEEVNESKRMLFNKHLSGSSDEQQQAQTLDVAHSANFTRNRFSVFRKNHSDDCLSSNYPNSSRSTCRDLTCSSISSGVTGMPSSSFVYDDLDSSSWKESTSDAGTNNQATNLMPSESFEYENTDDRSRIRQMEMLWEKSRGWRSPEKERKFMLQQRKMIEFMHHNEQQMMEVPSEFDDAQSEDSVVNLTISEVKPENDHHFIYNNVSSIPKVVNRNNKENPCVSTEKHKKIIFTPSFSPSSQTSSQQTSISTQKNEQWSRALKFGAVICGMRARHFGPAKNPDCPCDHCRRWAADRVQGRGRTLSVGDEPMTRSMFWLSRKK